MPKRQSQKEDNLVRMLRYALGVAPAEFGLYPLEDGWVPVKELLAALHQEEGWRHLRGSMIEDAANRVDPELVECDGKLVRVTQRDYPGPDYGATPPAHLYLGARRKAWPALHRRGLEAGHDGRPWLLATTKEAALKLGQRRDSEPVLVTVQAHQASDQGAMFPAWGEYFLCDWAPASALMGPPIDEQTRPAKKPKPKAKPPESPSMPSADSPPGSFTLMPEETEKPYKRKGIKKDIAWKRERRKDRRSK
ncbi:MAG: RNA 2'-phosphotransferase [Desulfarculaceae bacterium]|nr:RNA 2'-phosphotransferase [Desulfarculaceae bacterium]